MRAYELLKDLINFWRPQKLSSCSEFLQTVGYDSLTSAIKAADSPALELVVNWVWLDISVSLISSIKHLVY